MKKFLQKIIQVEDHEIAALLWSAAFFFCILGCFYVLRPLREALGAAGNENALSWLFLGTLAGTMLMNPLFAYLVSRFPRRKFIPLVYHFLALNIVAFYIFLPTEESDRRSVARIFFIWVSVFNLISVSLFWGLMADLFRTDQGKRLFGFISAGGTLGAIAGAALTVFLSDRLAPVHLCLIAAIFLEAATLCIKPLLKHFHLEKAEQAELRPAAESGAKTNIWSGIRFVWKSPYLLGICLYLIFYSLCGTFLYLEQAELVKAAFSDPAKRTAFFARIDLYVNIVGLFLGSLVTGRLIPVIGIGATLATLPIVFVGGFAVLGMTLSVAFVSFFQIARRSVDYSVAKPAREVLYTVVSREEKYTAKNLIDTFVYRFGDAVGALLNIGLKSLEWSTATICFGAIPVAALWIFNAFSLGKRQQELANPHNLPKNPAESPSPPR